MDCQLSRRRFLEWIGVSAGLATGLGFIGESASALRLALVVPGDGDALRRTSVQRGVGLGVEEARRTADLLGRSVELKTLTYGPGAAENIAQTRPAGVIGGLEPERLDELAEVAESVDALFLNVASRSDAHRDASCLPNALHFEASETMYENAVAQHGASAGETAVLWHPDLFRYGAAQLNDRFSRKYDAGMNSLAWAGWMAVKSIWEASLRAESMSAARLAAYLTNAATRFDGHKGWPLSFNAATGQLRQPLYIMKEDDVVAEVPERTESEPPHVQLDRLSHGASHAACSTHQ